MVYKEWRKGLLIVNVPLLEDPIVQDLGIC